ncbi:FAD-binding oxidoreductase [Burkholderia oklahomensis]|uniref:FAD-binding oxidoreductase n=1 Tax=Burkholderia oklahomensis TaxID=342113 RepID=UPI0005726406|nr:FAD-binding oxidoreductase [Burkholderia oklahomensis]AOI40482.1 oxidoreductase [Burkholderia oklahomensis EO147]AOI50115.1 oxidoreductase [Burkholderia oklahomensis C6786]KUY48684.1 oxidoreductase [Burkholderia oklahomensis EO147]KUY50244.1 oxidoreductase [Burkholderia oklahomensis C6786]MBI0363758.1 FAD-binding oxidoreductase [Burkholderia oklahomensis]
MTHFYHAVKSAYPAIVVSKPGDDDFAALSASWNIMTQFEPACVVQPNDTRQVSEIVKLANAYGIRKINARSGGHSFEGTSLGGIDGGGLVVDLVNMRSVHIDSAKNEAVVETGALLGHVAQQAWDQGRKMLPTGICVSVGIGGQASCGGYGMFAKGYGNMTDRIIEAEVVLADGTVVVANASQHADLLWALKGSGTGSFGIVTRYRFRLSDAPAHAAKFTFDYALDKIDFPAVFKRMQNFSLQSKENFTTMIVGWQGFLEITGTIVARNSDELAALIREIETEFDDSDKIEILKIDYIDIVKNIGLTQTSAPWYDDLTKIRRERDEHLRFMKIKAGFMKDGLPDEAIERLADIAARQNKRGARFQILSLDPRHNASDAESASIKARGCPLLMGMSVWIESEGKSLRAASVAAKQGVNRLAWLDECYELFHPFTVGGYIGDDDLDEWAHGRNLFDSYYGKNLDRLISIKNRYDPENLFRHDLSIPLERPSST